MKSLLLCAAALLTIPQHPGVVIKKVNHRGDVFPGFIEVLDQNYVVTDLMEYKLNGEPAEVLLNVECIRKVVRFEDSKKNDYACLVWYEGEKQPLLVRKEYDDLKSAIKKAASGKN